MWYRQVLKVPARPILETEAVSPRELRLDARQGVLVVAVSYA